MRNIKYQYLTINTSLMNELNDIVDSLNDLAELNTIKKDVEKEDYDLANASVYGLNKEIQNIGPGDLQKLSHRVEELAKLLNKEQRQVGHVCLRVELPDSDQVASPFMYKFTLSFSSPEDKFEKRKARQICNSKSSSSKWTKEYTADQKIPLQGMIYKVLGLDWSETNVRVPGWVWTKEVKIEADKAKISPIVRAFKEKYGMKW